MIEVNGLIKVREKMRVLDHVSLNVRIGEVAAIVGPSGGGKSTLLRCINGLETFEGGEITVGQHLLVPGASHPSAMLQSLRRRVGMVFQQFNLFPHCTALENVLAGPLWVLGQPRSLAEPSALELLERVGLANKANSRISELSGGQQQRVAIARALAVKPEAILFDEPTSSLDPRMAKEVLAVISELAQDGQTMVVVTHAMEFARQVAHTVHVMQAGRIVESGPSEQIFGNPQSEATREFLTIKN